MLKLHTFYRQFEGTEKNDRFQPIEKAMEPTSLFVIFQQLTQVRAQLRYFEDRKEQLLKLAELGFQQLEEKKRKEADNI